MKIYGFILGLLMSLSATLVAQNTISGIITNASTGKPLAGVAVSINNQQKTISNSNGQFTVNCTGSSEISFSHIGFTSIVKQAECGSELSIALHATTLRLDEFEITATSNPNKSQLEQPLSLMKINQEAIQRGTGIYMTDAINTNIPGVYMGRRTASAGQQINIRGYGSGMGFRGINNNFDNQGIKVYLNGIALTDAEGITMLDDIDFNSVENVEVLKGPSGTLYGLAIAGVVNLQMQKAQKNKVSIGQDIQAGNYGMLRSTTRLAIGGERSSILINYGKQQFAGFMPNTETNKDFVNVMGEFEIDSKQLLTSYFGYTNSYNQRNGELSVAQYEAFDYTGNTRYIKNDAHSAMRTFRAGLAYQNNIAKWIQNETSVFGSAQAIDQSSAAGWTDKYPVNAGFRSTFTTKFTLKPEIKLTGITGIEMQTMDAQNISYSMGTDSTNIDGLNVITGFRSNSNLKSNTYNYFTQWTLTLPYSISINAGVGVSSMNFTITDRLWYSKNNVPGNSTPKSFTANYNNLVAPSVAINKQFGKVASVYASYSTGYKAPVSSNVLISFTNSLNSGLLPEFGEQFEIGTKGSFLNNRLFYTLAVFNAQFKDKFTTETVQDETNTVTLYSFLVNGGTLNNTGIEAMIQYNALKSDNGFFTQLQPFANFTFSDFKYNDFVFKVASQGSTIINDFSGNPVAGVAPIVANAGVDVATKLGVYGNAVFNYRSVMPITSAGDFEAHAYSLLNAKIGYRNTLKNLDYNVFVGANNITSTQYYNMVFINQMPDAYVPAPNEINFFGGLQLKYTF